MSDDRDQRDDENKVVPFPTHKVKKPRAVANTTLGQPRATELWSQRHTTFVVSLVATIAVSITLTGRQGDDRMPASAVTTIERDLDEEVRLAKRVSRDSLRGPASRGTAPSREDQLRHGQDLQGVYALKFNDAGHLTGIEYKGEAKKERFVRDRMKFIRDNRDLLHITFDKVDLNRTVTSPDIRKPSSSRGSKRDANGATFETYDLKQGDKVQAQVHFEVDGDRLFKMSVDTNPEL